jgi:hypothetical protein
MIIFIAITMLMLLVGCNNRTPTETMNPSPISSSTPTSKSSQTPSPTPDPTQSGETKTFNFDGLKLEVTNVYEVRTESMKDDGGNPWEYRVFVYYPGARVTVLAAGMSDVNFSADGKSHANWGVLLESDARNEIVDNMKPFDLTPDMLGIYSLESSLYVLKFEMYKE